MVTATDDQIKAIGKVLKDPSRPLKERFRALFTLRNIGGSVAIECINDTFTDSSSLLKHELAYCLGQMQDQIAVKYLIKVLEDTNQESIVRHEAAEALGAIASNDAIEYLKKYKDDPIQEIRETCEIALERINWLNSSESKEEVSTNPFLSIDPAPPTKNTSVKDLTSILLDNNVPLFERYRAMFTLRNMRCAEATISLCEALTHGSALFKHEVAFVLGQIQDSLAVPFLKEVLCDTREHEMVRHECAEALGAIANQDCLKVLVEYLIDKKQVVKESCEIALDMCEYENSPEFQYANTLQRMK